MKEWLLKVNRTLFELETGILLSAGNLLTAFIGVMGLKVSAYLQPVTKKISRAVYGEEILPDIITENPVDEQETRR